MIFKVCGMRDLSNMKALEALKPDLMGMIFYPASKRYISDISVAVKVKQINIPKVGVFVNAPIETILSYAGLFGFEIVQLHGDEAPTFCHELQLNGFKIIKAFSIGDTLDETDMQSYIGSCDFFLFDTKTQDRGGSGQKFNWAMLNNYTFEVPFILSGGIAIGDEDKIRAIQHHKFAGIDINSKFEVSPGMKNIELIKKFKNRLYNDNN